jgi:hypothetical protein
VQKAKPNSLLDKVVHQISSSGASNTQSTAQSAAAAITKYANLFTSSAAAATSAAKNAVNQGSMTSPTSSKPHLPGHLNVPRPDGARSGATTPSPGGRPGLQRQDSVRGDAVNKSLEEKVWATDGVVTVETAERMLRWHAEAVGRVMELSGVSDVYVAPC